MFPPVSPNTDPQEALRGTNIHMAFQTFHISSVKDIAWCGSLRKTAVVTASSEGKLLTSGQSFFTCYTKNNPYTYCTSETL